MEELNELPGRPVRRQTAIGPARVERTHLRDGRRILGEPSGFGKRSETRQRILQLFKVEPYPTHSLPSARAIDVVPHGFRLFHEGGRYRAFREADAEPGSAA